ncbi:MAG: hypothetical protein P8J20_16125 [Novosphingobium sp.]|nr:hypothetical protein [Novosphingobium sp.]
MGHTGEVERLRPAAMQSRPVRIEKAFNDPDAILRLVESRAPYKTIAAYHQMEDMLGGANTQPFFRGMFEDEVLLHNPLMIEAAKRSFNAGIVRPFKCLAQLNAPMTGTGVHYDLPLFRGFGQQDNPVWLLMNMSYSGLFQDWMVPVASGLAWFWRGEGGAFACWPDGVDAPPMMERSPLWNCGVVSDNEYMFHGVSPIGAAADREAIRGTLGASNLLHCVGECSWEIRDGERVVHRLSGEQVRISLLWKAHVFRDDRHLASFEDRAMDLSLDQVVEIYCEDLAARGVVVSRPAGPLDDEKWKATLETTYPQPLSPNAADAL